MKRNLLKLMAISLAICSALLLGTTINESKANANDNLVPIYRLYNDYNKEHLYTSDAHEKDVLYSQYGWGYEGVGWYAPKGGTPVYRLYNGSLHNHLYTTDLNEIKTLTSKYGWVMDNNGNPLFYSGGNVGIYRLYLPTNNGLHHMTTDTREYNVLPGLQGWKQEGLKLYAAKVGNPIKTTYANQPNNYLLDPNDVSDMHAILSLSGVNVLKVGLHNVFNDIGGDKVIAVLVSEYFDTNTRNYYINMGNSAYGDGQNHYNDNDSGFLWCKYKGEDVVILKFY